MHRLDPARIAPTVQRMTVIFSTAATTTATTRATIEARRHVGRYHDSVSWIDGGSRCGETEVAVRGVDER